MSLAQVLRYNHGGELFRTESNQQLHQSPSRVVLFEFHIRLGQIQMSWLDDKVTKKSSNDHYQLRLFLLNSTDSEEENDFERRTNSLDWIRRGKKFKEDRHRHQGKQLTRVPVASVASRVMDGDPLTKVDFGQQMISFTCKMVVCFEDGRCRFRSQVVRIKLEHCHKSHTDPIGFFDLDLSHHVTLDRCSNFCVPMVFFSDYSKQLQHRAHKDRNGNSNFCFNIRFGLESIPNHKIETEEIDTLRRIDSLPNLSSDRELKYHDSPPISRYQHLLNLFGLLPPGQLFRVSIHFGKVEHLQPNHKSPQSVSACFEVKHPATLFEDHRRQATICCRTAPLTNWTFSEESCGQFDEYFTFFENFSDRDSPDTCLSIVDGDGRKLYKYKCHLVEYLNCRSVNQYFYLQGKHDTFCRLQFSIVVKPAH